MIFLKKYRIMILLVLLLVSFSIFVYANDENTKPGTILKETAQDAIINVTVGKEFVIIMDANKTTGFDWQFAEPIDEKIIKFKKSEYVPNVTGYVGAGGKEIWTFEAFGLGATTIFLKYVRPWEDDTPREEKMSFNVLVSEK